jgi:molybdate/tungstate transport system ATP-binding protein
MIQVDQLIIAAGPSLIGPVTFRVAAQGHVSLMGRTGTGKTSILEALAGLRRVTGGTIRLAGRDVTTLRPAARGVGYVPQDLALFTTMTVRQHLAFGPRVQGWPPADIDRQVDVLATLLGLGHLLGRKPAGLSGGEAQRTALGRALAAKPSILLLDEPLSALDDQTRHEMYALLRSVRDQTGVTTLHVTHNLQEAEMLADEVLLLEGGAVRRTTVAELRAASRGAGGGA